VVRRLKPSSSKVSRLPPSINTTSNTTRPCTNGTAVKTTGTANPSLRQISFQIGEPHLLPTMAGIRHSQLDRYLNMGQPSEYEMSRLGPRNRISSRLLDPNLNASMYDQRLNASNPSLAPSPAGTPHTQYHQYPQYPDTSREMPYREAPTHRPGQISRGPSTSRTPTNPFGRRRRGTHHRCRDRSQTTMNHGDLNSPSSSTLINRAKDSRFWAEPRRTRGLARIIKSYKTISVLPLSLSFCFLHGLIFNYLCDLATFAFILS
jgi:hypothetical protein